MSDDLVRRLRVGVPIKPIRSSGDPYAGGEWQIEQADRLMSAAADRIELLEAELQQVANEQALAESAEARSDSGHYERRH